MKEILLEIVSILESVAVSVDSLEAVLIHKGQLRSGEIEEYTTLRLLIAREKLEALRDAIDRLR